MPEHHATPSELLWTLQLKRFRLQLEHDVFCDISPVLSDRKFESNVLHLIQITCYYMLGTPELADVQLVGVVFGSLLCTTEASNFQANQTAESSTVPNFPP